MKKYLAAAALFFVLGSITLPLVAEAQFTPYWGPILSCTGNYISEGTVIKAKCTSLCDLLATVSNIVRFIYTISIFIVAPLMFIYGGILYMISSGDHHGISEANKIMTGTVIGVILIFGSYLIVSTILWGLSVLGTVGGEGGAASPVQWPNIACRPEELPGGGAGVIRPQDFILQEGENYGCRIVEYGAVIVRCSPSRSNTCSDISCGSNPCVRVDSCTQAPVSQSAQSSGCMVPFKDATRFQCYPGTTNCGGGVGCSNAGSACLSYASSDCSGTPIPQ